MQQQQIDRLNNQIEFLKNDYNLDYVSIFMEVYFKKYYYQNQIMNMSLNVQKEIEIV